ncbi:MAG: ArsR/SmtB family transcription factor [Armatimonadota bacterium]
MDQINRIYAALGNEVRLEIVQLLALRHESCACELVELLGLSTTAVSYHIARLRDAGLVEEEKRGRWRVLRLNRRVLEQFAPPLAEKLASLPGEDFPPLEERIGCPSVGAPASDN